MFESLSDRFDGIFSGLRSKGRLTEADVDEVLREIRLALLEADVNLSVVKSLQARIRERAVGDELSRALNPALQVKKVVLEELTTTLGGETLRITYASKPPTVVLMAGLQGSGKTTNSAKLATLVPRSGPQPDPGRRRPAASRGGRAAAHPRPPGRRPGLLRRGRRGRVRRRRPRRRRAGCDRRGAAARTRRGHRATPPVDWRSTPR